ncbi:zinc finger protein OZF-like [Amyelois transitella]|uniref:zinc finger protein OZF-like n=1 Tax=Amyelois transitella TaxID=680683 RepID=UPI00298FACAF|nr:zinc finger protein OZF-like [Amyelois transitella]
MSSESVTIKKEPDIEPAVQQNVGHNGDMSQPEFVNIKIEIEPHHPEISIKTEPTSDNEEDIQQNLWHVPPAPVSVKTEPLDYTINRPLLPDCVARPVQLIVAPIIYEPNTSESQHEDEIQPTRLLNGEYVCPICKKMFTTKGHAQRHIALHSRRSHPCHSCGKTFTREELLQKHVATQHERTYPCDECPKVFRTSSNLQQHKKSHLKDKPYFCDKCHRYFAIKANLTKHQGKSRCKRPIDEPIQCHVCHKIFQKEFLLKSHLRRHTSEKPYSCDECKMNFKYKSTLIRHVQIHKEDKPFTCDVCDKPFTHPGLIKPHMRIHTGEKPYECPVCKKKFSHKHNMQRHSVRHEKVKHTTCNICNKKFPKESRLKYHMRVHSDEKLQFVCQFCPKKFSHKQNIVRHYSKKHPEHSYNEKLTDAGVALKIWQEVLRKNELVGKNDIMIKEESERGVVGQKSEKGMENEILIKTEPKTEIDVVVKQEVIDDLY